MTKSMFKFQPKRAFLVELRIILEIPLEIAKGYIRSKDIPKEGVPPMSDSQLARVSSGEVTANIISAALSKELAKLPTAVLNGKFPRTVPAPNVIRAQNKAGKEGLYYLEYLFVSENPEGDESKLRELLEKELPKETEIKIHYRFINIYSIDKESWNMVKSK